MNKSYAKEKRLGGSIKIHFEKQYAIDLVHYKL